MKTWTFETYTVYEVPHDYDLHAFEVFQNGELVHTITPSDIEMMEILADDLDAGIGVNGWEDGQGNTIYIEEAAK